MDTIIWLDGHTSKISSKEANSKSYNIIIHGRYEFRLMLQNSEFAWRGNCWKNMDIKNNYPSDKEFEICLVIATFLLIASIVSYHYLEFNVDVMLP